MYRSHRTQQMLNYFDENDVRVRENPVTIDAQLLNIAAVQLDDLEQRTQREIDARSVSTCPSCLDSRGVYQAVKVPNTYIIPPEGTDPTVEGLRRGVWTRLTKYDDRLPVPQRLELDPQRQAVPLPNPLLMDVTGSGDDLNQIWNIQTATPGLLPVPNKLVFYIEGMANASALLDIVVSGEKYPQSAWANERIKSNEEITTIIDGTLTTRFPWAQVDSIVVKNLPTGARCRVWSLAFNLPAYLDTARPYTDPGYRDRLFPRYWQIDSNGFVNEMFTNNNFVGLEYVQSYAPGTVINDLALEPRTGGMYAVSKNRLLYFDRREPMPGSLGQTGITAEPIFGIQVVYDQTKIGQNRYAAITPYPYAGAASCVQSRYLMQDPAGSLFILLSDGSVAPYVANQGWKNGQPKPVSVPLLQNGTYVFSIQCQSTDGNVYQDVFPYNNLVLNPLATLDLSVITSAVRGVCFDHLEQLWIWNGAFAVPVKVHYDGFVVDRDNNAIYLTDSFEQVRLS